MCRNNCKPEVCDVRKGMLSKDPATILGPPEGCSIKNDVLPSAAVFKVLTIDPELDDKIDTFLKGVHVSDEALEAGKKFVDTSRRTSGITATIEHPINRININGCDLGKTKWFDDNNEVNPHTGRRFDDPEEIEWAKKWNPKPTGPACPPEPTQPNYYKFNIKGTDCNMFDIARALGLSLELFSALKYFRVKGNADKRINDLQKAKECIDLEIKKLTNNRI